MMYTSSWNVICTATHKKTPRSFKHSPRSFKHSPRPFLAVQSRDSVSIFAIVDLPLQCHHDCNHHDDDRWRQGCERGFEWHWSMVDKRSNQTNEHLVCVDQYKWKGEGVQGSERLRGCEVWYYYNSIEYVKIYHVIIIASLLFLL